MNVDVSNMDAQGVMALFMGMVRGERFCDGTIMKMIKSGAVKKWLLRLKEIKEIQSMKTVRVVAAVIKSTNENKEPIIFATQRGYGDFKGGWEFPGGKIEEGETPEQALKREIMEELDTEISVGELIDTIEYDYPQFHLSMDCFWCEIVSGNLVLKEHEAARWLTKKQLNDVKWLPADVTLIEKIGKEIPGKQVKRKK